MSRVHDVAPVHRLVIYSNRGVCRADEYKVQSPCKMQTVSDIKFCLDRCQPLRRQTFTASRSLCSRERSQDATTDFMCYTAHRIKLFQIIESPEKYAIQFFARSRKEFASYAPQSYFSRIACQIGYCSAAFTAFLCVICLGSICSCGVDRTEDGCRCCSCAMGGRWRYTG